MKIENVNGKDKGKIILYALSTCGWCRKTKELLDQLGVAYSYVYVDKLRGKEQEDTIEEIKRWNPKCSFPTIVVKNKVCIVGFKIDEIIEAIG